MYSKFGDLYDHISDAIILICLVYIFYKKSIHYNYRILLISILIFTGIFCWLYYRKQEEYYNVLKNKPDEIDKVDMSSMKFLRYFGPGCVALFITLIIMISPSFTKS